MSFTMTPRPWRGGLIPKEGTVSGIELTRPDHVPGLRLTRMDPKLKGGPAAGYYFLHFSESFRQLESPEREVETKLRLKDMSEWFYVGYVFVDLRCGDFAETKHLEPIDIPVCIQSFMVPKNVERDTLYWLLDKIWDADDGRGQVLNDPRETLGLGRHHGKLVTP